jgi:hypothetical protein
MCPYAAWRQARHPSARSSRPSSSCCSSCVLTLQRHHYSYRTEQSYLHWIRRFVRFHHAVILVTWAQPGSTAILNYLAVERRVALATQNQTLSALLYRDVLESPFPDWMGSSGPNGPRP